VGHEYTHRLRDQQDERKKHEDLQPPIGCHIRTSPDAAAQTASTPSAKR
jgi:hypothetical protein